MADTFRIGPARILIASSITDPVENWTDLGPTRGDVVVEPHVRISTGHVDQTGSAPRADMVMRIGEISSTKAPMLDKALALLNKQYPGSSIVTGGGKTSLAFGIPNGFVGALTGVAVAIVPLDTYIAGAAWWASDYTVWIPAAVFKVGGELKYALPAEGDDDLAASARDVEIVSLRSAAGVPSSVQGLGGLGQIWLQTGVSVLGLDLVIEAGTGDTATTPIIGGLGTFARNSTKVFKDAVDGKYKSAGVNVLAREVEGFRIDPQRTMKNTAKNCLFAGATTGWTTGGDAALIFSVPLDAAELALASLDLTVTDSYVLKLDNTAGVAVAYIEAAGTAGNANKHTGSAFIRGGTGSVRFNNVIVVAFGAQATPYRRVAGTGVPGSGNSLRIYADPGQVVYAVLPVFEEGEFATAPILNTTGAGQTTRLADDWGFAGLSAIDSVNGAIAQAVFRPLFGEAITQNGGTVIQLGHTNDPRFSLQHATPTGWHLRLADTVNVDVQPLVGDNFLAGVEAEVTIAWDPALAKKYAAFQSDVSIDPAAAATAVPAVAWGLSTIRVGTGQAGQFGGHIKRIVVARGIAAAAIAAAPALLRKLTRL